MSSDNSVRIHDDSDHVAESIKNASRDIHESSSTTKQLVHTLVRTGAFEEIARAILETTIAIRDIVNDVNETVKDLKERGTIKETEIPKQDKQYPTHESRQLTLSEFMSVICFR